MLIFCCAIDNLANPCYNPLNLRMLGVCSKLVKGACRGIRAASVFSTIREMEVYLVEGTRSRSSPRHTPGNPARSGPQEAGTGLLEVARRQGRRDGDGRRLRHSEVEEGAR